MRVSSQLGFGHGVKASYKNVENVKFKHVFGILKYYLIKEGYCKHLSKTEIK